MLHQDPDVATNGDPFGFNDEERGSDFGTGESRPLGRVSTDDEPVMSLEDFWALAFFFFLFSFGRCDGVGASVAIEVATGSGAKGGEGGVSLLRCWDVNNDALVPLGDFS